MEQKHGYVAATGTGSYARTDLACEAGEAYREIKREYRLLDSPQAGGYVAEVVRYRSREGGRYVVVGCGRMTERSERELDRLATLLGEELVTMATDVMGRPLGGDRKILLVGLGNAGMTADAIGPKTVERVTVTRHLRSMDGDMYCALGCCELSAVTPGVLGQTGVESCELVRGVVEHVHPDLVLTVDALAARSCERLSSTIQLSDQGIGPGSGIGNLRKAIDRQTVGCPVLALGVPTVVDSATLVWDALEQAGVSEGEVCPALRQVLRNGRSFIVSPRESDRITEIAGMTLARAIDRAFGVSEK